MKWTKVDQFQNILVQIETSNLYKGDALPCIYTVICSVKVTQTVLLHLDYSDLLHSYHHTNDLVLVSYWILMKKHTKLTRCNIFWLWKKFKWKTNCVENQNINAVFRLKKNVAENFLYGSIAESPKSELSDFFKKKHADLSKAISHELNEIFIFSLWLKLSARHQLQIWCRHYGGKNLFPWWKNGECRKLVDVSYLFWAIAAKPLNSWIHYWLENCSQ